MAIRMMEVLMGKKTAVILPNFSSPFRNCIFGQQYGFIFSKMPII